MNPNQSPASTDGLRAAHDRGDTRSSPESGGTQPGSSQSLGGASSKLNRRFHDASRYSVRGASSTQRTPQGLGLS